MSKEDLDLMRRTQAVIHELGFDQTLDPKIKIGHQVNIGQHSGNLDGSGAVHKGNARITAIDPGRTYAYADCTMRNCNVRQILRGNGGKSNLFVTG